MNCPAGFEKLIGMEELKALLGLSERSIQKLVKRGGFPPPIKLGRVSKWSQQALHVWLDEKVQTQITKARKTAAKS